MDTVQNELQLAAYAADDGDKRKVSTDALETLGTLIGPNEKRDAIHLAVLPVIAGSYITPGSDVKLNGEGLAINAYKDDGIGIADPFLKLPGQNGKMDGSILPGQRFWLVIYPRKINSLRHVWTHPEIPDDAGAADPVNTPDPREESRQWLEDYAHRLFSYEPEYGTRFEVLMKCAEEGYFGTDIEGEWCTPTDEFWFHFERYTGKKVQNRPEYFSCAC